MKPIEAISIMANMPEVVYPMFWVEEGVAMNKTYTNMLKYQLFLLVFDNNTKYIGWFMKSVYSFRAYKFQAFVKWTGIIFGGLALAVGAYMHYKHSTSAMTVTPVKAISKPTELSSPSSAVSIDGKNQHYIGMD